MGNCAGQGGARRGGRVRGLGLGRRIEYANRGNSWLESQLNNLQAAIEKLAERLDKINQE
jgi:hypothetical protein